MEISASFAISQPSPYLLSWNQLTWLRKP
jgi:hypothetical protein